jgi:hypothetical protein
MQIQQENIFYDRLEWTISDRTLLIIKCYELYKRKKRGKDPEYIGLGSIQRLQDRAKREYELYLRNNLLFGSSVYTMNGRDASAYYVVSRAPTHYWCYNSNGRKNKEFAFLSELSGFKKLDLQNHWSRLETSDAICSLKSHAITSSFLEEFMLYMLSTEQEF